MRRLAVRPHRERGRERRPNDVDPALGDRLRGPRNDHIGRGLGLHERVRERDSGLLSLRERRRRGAECDAGDGEGPDARNQCGPTTRSSKDPGTMGGRVRGAPSGAGDGGGPNFAAGR